MFKNLDHLRAISALLVFFSHIFQIFWLSIIGTGTWQHTTVHFLSESAVFVFFVLSGYVIAKSLSKNIKRNNGHLIISEYFVNRFSRIYPPFLFSVFIAITVYCLVLLFKLPGSNQPLGVPQDIYHAREYITIGTHELLSALILNNGLLEINGPLWSLYIEVRMYVLAGLFAMLFVIGRTISLFKKIMWLSLLFIFAMWLFPTLASLFYPFWWLTGVLYFYYTELRPSQTKLILSLITVLIALVLLNKVQMYSTVIQYSVICILFYFAISLRARESKILSHVSSFSYTLYVVHFPLGLLCYAIFSYYFYVSVPSLLDRGVASLISIFFILVLVKTFGIYVENIIFFQRHLSIAFKKIWARYST